jgi:hypothetical protein
MPTWTTARRAAARRSRQVSWTCSTECKFKVYNHLADWFEEFRLYHRKDGKVVKLYDDLMAATRYAVMMLREAKTLEPPPPLRYAACRSRRLDVELRSLS